MGLIGTVLVDYCCLGCLVDLLCLLKLARIPSLLKKGNIIVLGVLVLDT